MDPSTARFPHRRLLLLLVATIIWPFASSWHPSWNLSPPKKTRQPLELGLAQQDSTLTDWVVENLEDDGDCITSSSSKTRAGENDTLPLAGLCISQFRILAAHATVSKDDDDDDLLPIRLLLGRNGWGTGVHPTTRLCLEWLAEHALQQNAGEVVLDYGCGSGILSLAALQLGASRALGVDVEAEALVSAERNMELNGMDGRFEGFHTREIVPFGLCRPTGVDVAVANILVGQLVRPSMVSALASNIVSGGLLCLSGIRPEQVDALKDAYGTSFDWLDDQYAELSANECEGSIESYGFDCGRWARLIGRRRNSNRQSDIERMSESAIQ